MTAQSTTYSPLYPAKNAIDGSSKSAKQCAITKWVKTQDPWWQVDLGARYSVDTVRITNRPDGSGKSKP